MDGFLAATILKPPADQPLGDGIATRQEEDSNLIDNLLIKLLKSLRRLGFSQIVTRIKNLNKRFDELPAKVSVDDSRGREF